MENQISRLQQQVVDLQQELKELRGIVSASMPRPSGRLHWQFAAIAALAVMILAAGSGPGRSVLAGPGSADPLTVSAPFTVVNSAGMPIFEVTADTNGGSAVVKNNAGQGLAGIKVIEGSGCVLVTRTGGKAPAVTMAVATKTNSGYIQLNDTGGKKRVFLGTEYKSGQTGMQVYGSGGEDPVAYIGQSKTGNGLLGLVTENKTGMVQVGATQDGGGNGYIDIYGSKGKSCDLGPNPSTGNMSLKFFTPAGVPAVGIGITTEGVGALHIGTKDGKMNAASIEATSDGSGRVDVFTALGAPAASIVASERGGAFSVFNSSKTTVAELTTNSRGTGAGLLRIADPSGTDVVMLGHDDGGGQVCRANRTGKLECLTLLTAVHGLE